MGTLISAFSCRFSAVNGFSFGMGLLSGISIAVLVSLVWPKWAKTPLRICGILFIGFNIYAIAHYNLRHLAPRLHGFYSANGLLIGLAGSLAILLWQQDKRTRRSENGKDGIAPGTVAGSVDTRLV